MKKPLLTHRILFLCAGLLLAAAGSMQVQAQCRNKFVQVSIGYSHVLAVAEDGTLWAWGYNQQGQVGNGTTTRQTRPVQIGTDHDWKQVRAGKRHSMAVKTNGTLWAWGKNDLGQLGLGHTTDQTTPVQVGTDTDWDWYRLCAAEGGNSFGVKTNGSLWFWGHNAASGVTVVPAERPSYGRNWKEIATTESGTLGIKTDGSLWTWLPGGDYLPRQVGTDRDWKAAATNGGSSLAIKEDGTLWSWGGNQYGELGNGRIDHDHRLIATQVGTDRDWKMVASVYYNSFALKDDGSLWTWGRGNDRTNILGDGTRVNRAVPIRVGGV